MTDKCRAPNLCKLASDWIWRFDLLTWLDYLPSEMLLRIITDVGYEIVGKDLVEHVCLQRDGVIIKLPLMTSCKLKYIQPMLDNMTKVEFSDVHPIMWLYFDRQIVLDLGYSIKARVSGIKIMGYDYLRFVIHVTKEKDVVAKIHLTYYIKRDHTIAEDIYMKSITKLHIEMLPYIIADILDDRYRELNDILEQAYNEIYAIERNTRKFLKYLGEIWTSSLKCEES